ncbi:hypothetical protein [Rickettsiella massiliensis]|uniref:hypothetical protein n=1 Tax=Rickettsiella massiliensis TaxID=676517 RepID=UPI0012EAFF42|nr:hypothetical protein [Rickettsiella massiliensis]
MVPKNSAKHLSDLINHLAMLAAITKLNDQRQLAHSARPKGKFIDYFPSINFLSSKAELPPQEKQWLDLAQSDAKKLNDIIEKMSNKTETNQDKKLKIHESIEKILKNKLKEIMKKYPPLNDKIKFCCVIIGKLLIDKYTHTQRERFLESLAAAIDEEHIYEEINYEEINDVKKTEDSLQTEF